MKRIRLFILVGFIVVSIGTYGIYSYFNQKSHQPTRGTFISNENINNYGDENELYDLYKSTENSFFI